MFCEKVCGYLEVGIVFFLGLWIHLKGHSIIELSYSKLPTITPNVASTLFVFSVLGVFAKLRPFWNNSPHLPQALIRFIVELALIQYGTEFLLRQVWVPSMMALQTLCSFLGKYVVVANVSLLAANPHNLSAWIRSSGFYLARFSCALLTFAFMVNTTGVMNEINEVVQVILEHVSQSDLIRESAPRDLLRQYLENVRQYTPSRVSFNVEEIPHVPQRNLLDSRLLVSVRRKRQIESPAASQDKLDN